MAFTHSGRSCRGPCRRRGRPESPAEEGASQESPRRWYGRSVPRKPSGVSIGSSRSSAWPESRSPSQPSASTPASGRSPGMPASGRCAPSTLPSASAAVMVPLVPRRSRNFSAAFRCLSSSSTHWPRTRTSGKNGECVPEPIKKEDYKGNIAYRTSSERHYHVAKLANTMHKSISKTIDALIDKSLDHLKAI